MKHLSLKLQILRYLKSRPNEWVHKSEIGSYAERLGYMNENGTRRMRELTNEYLTRIEKREVPTKSHTKTVEYRYTPSPEERMHTNYQRTGQLTLITQ